MLSVAWKDLQILFRDRGNLVGTFILPIAFIVAFIGVSGLANAESQQELRPIAVVNHDAGPMSAQLLAQLPDAAGLAPTVYDEADAMDRLRNEELSRVLVIPAGFSDGVEGGTATQVRLVTNTTNRQESDSILMAVQGITRGMSLEQQIVASLRQLARMQEANPDFDPRTSAELAIPLAEDQFAASRERPLVAVTAAQPSSVSEQAEVEVNGVQIGVPGFAVLFIFLTAQVTARSIHEERKTGSFRRLLAAPLGKWSMLAGKLLPNFVVVLLQAVFLFATGIFILPLMGLDALRLGNDPLALVLLVLMVALCCTALGVLIAAVAKTEAQIGGISGLVLWVLAFLGGSFIPLFLINDSLATIGQVTPHYWAVTGFYDVLTRGQGLAAIVDSLLALAGFTVAFLLIGVWRFEFE